MAPKTAVMMKATMKLRTRVRLRAVSKAASLALEKRLASAVSCV